MLESALACKDHLSASSRRLPPLFLPLLRAAAANESSVGSLLSVASNYFDRPTMAVTKVANKRQATG